MILLSPTEHDLLPLLGDKAKSHSLPEKLGADILIISQGKLGIQRKEFPSDFFASIKDGRLAKELTLMRQCTYAVLMPEGKPNWTAEGHLAEQWHSRWTKQGLRNLLRSAWMVHGVWVEWTEDIYDTRDAILEIEAWFTQNVHRSLLTRSKQSTIGSWGQRQDMLGFFYQGIEGVGSVVAEELGKVYLSPASLCQASVKELCQVPHIGKKTAEGIYKFLHESPPDGGG